MKPLIGVTPDFNAGGGKEVAARFPDEWFSIGVVRIAAQRQRR